MIFIIEPSRDNMLRIVEAQARENYRLFLKFQNNREGIVDLSQHERKGVFERWNDITFFEQVSIDEESGTVIWPGDIDLDPYVLYSKMTNIPIQEVLNLV